MESQLRSVNILIPIPSFHELILLSQGPVGDTEGITEQRINTWFTNRRKGLATPSPTREGFGLSGLSESS